MSNHTPLQSILDMVDAAVEDGETDLKALVESFGDRAFGPILGLAGLFTMTPLGAIPGIPAAFGLIVIVFAVQLLLRRDTPWMPKVIARVIIKKETVDKARRFIRPVLAAGDHIVHPRLQWAATGPASVLAALIAIVLSITMVPLGAIPFGVVIPGFVILLLGIGIMARDGIVMLIAFALTLGAATFLIRLIRDLPL